MSPSLPLPTAQTAVPQKDSPTSAVNESAATVDDGKGSAKSPVNHPYLDVPLGNAFARSSDTVSDISVYSVDNENEGRTGRPPDAAVRNPLSSLSPVPPPVIWKSKVQVFWTKNKGLALVMLAQFFGVMMSVTTRLLEMDGRHGPGMHPFQVRPVLCLSSLTPM